MIEGMVAATLTPFSGAGRLRQEEVERHVDWLARAGLPAVAPAGTTGEALYLTPAERMLVVSASVRGAAGRLKVIAGIWDLDARGVRHLAAAAETAGADAVFLTTPVFYPATDAAIAAWYRSAREATSLPLLAYNIPQYAVNRISAGLFRSLLDEGTVQGIKDSSGNEESLSAYLSASEGRGTVYGASDSFSLRARALGASGFISALANIFPRTCLRIWTGTPGEAAEAQAGIDRIRAAVKGYGGIGALKAMLRMRGFSFGGTRLPFSNPSLTDCAALERLMSGLGD